MPEFDYKKYKPSGDNAVDTIIACCAYHRENKLPIKTISVMPAMFEKWDSYMRRVIPEEQQTGAYMFDGINIERGSILQATVLLVEFYKSEITAVA